MDTCVIVMYEKLGCAYVNILRVGIYGCAYMMCIGSLRNPIAL